MQPPDSYIWAHYTRSTKRPYTVRKREAEDEQPPPPNKKVKSSENEGHFIQLPRELRDSLYKTSSPVSESHVHLECQLSVH
jgi:hypothetical protein